MINDDLLRKFESIEELPISEEMLGAYMEGNLDSYEISQIETAISEDSSLLGFVEDIISDGESILDNLEQQIYVPSYTNFMLDIHLPNFEDGITHENFYNEHLVAACYTENPINTCLPESSFPSDSLFENNTTSDDIFDDEEESLNSNEDFHDEETFDI